MHISKTPKPPYYAVIFTSKRTVGDNNYSDSSDKILEIAKKQPGYLGFESARNEIGISVSYWKDLESIKAWKSNVDHMFVKAKANIWYQKYKVRISKVEMDYGSDFS